MPITISRTPKISCSSPLVKDIWETGALVQGGTKMILSLNVMTIYGENFVADSGDAEFNKADEMQNHVDRKMEILLNEVIGSTDN